MIDDCRDDGQTNQVDGQWTKTKWGKSADCSFSLFKIKLQSFYLRKMKKRSTMASPADVVRMINKVNRPSVLQIDIITSSVNWLSQLCVINSLIIWRWPYLVPAWETHPVSDWWPLRSECRPAARCAKPGACFPKPCRSWGCRDARKTTTNSLPYS